MARGWDEMGLNGLGWDGMGLNRMAWDGMGLNGLGWHARIDGRCYFFTLLDLL